MNFESLCYISVLDPIGALFPLVFTHADTELQVSNFSPEQRVKSFTPEFDLESSDMIKAQLHWDFAPKVKTTKVSYKQKLPGKHM